MICDDIQRPTYLIKEVGMKRFENMLQQMFYVFRTVKNYNIVLQTTRKDLFHS